MPSEPIRVRGCRVHNLKGVDVDVPRGQLVVVCGLSGSGKTSFALDTLYAEGQRRYIESFSAYTRQFLQRLDKPDCDSIEGIPPAIAVTRAGGIRTSRSTVGTATEIADHLRLLFAKVATLHCFGCGTEIQRHDPSIVAASIRNLPDSTRVMVGFEVELGNREQTSERLAELQRNGFQRLVVSGKMFHLADADRGELAESIPRRGAVTTVIVDRLTPASELSQITESLETAMGAAEGRCIVITEKGVPLFPRVDQGSSRKASSLKKRQSAANEDWTIDGRAWTRTPLSDRLRCDTCGIDYPEPSQRLFHFNQPLGACPKCEGFGDVVDIDMERVIPNPELSIREGAIQPWNSPSYRHELDELIALAGDYKIPIDTPFRSLKKKHLKLIKEGVAERQFGGLDGFFAWLERKKYKMHIRVMLSRYRSYRRCPECEGRRLRPEALAYQVGGMDIAEFSGLRGDQLASILSRLELDPTRQQISREPREQILRRLDYLDRVGLSYLQLDRTLRTLSGGEIQRVALTGALGSSLVNMLYVLDEPTAGLHPADVDKLRESILGLRDRGNSVVVVEHEESLMRSADRLIEFGPGAGDAGGEIVYEGPLEGMLRDRQSLTGRYLAGRGGEPDIPTKAQHRQPRGFITLRGARGHNLKGIDVSFPLGVLCLVTGVSGSGKSTLVQDTLYPAIRKHLGLASDPPLAMDRIDGLLDVRHCELIDQAPISRSPRSNPVTYVKAMDAIRHVFAETVEARIRNYGPGHFSFNSEEGRCPTCEGDGQMTIDMQFMADVAMTCPACRGSRYREEILQVRYRDRSIADCLKMTVRSAHAFFRGEEKVQERLERLIAVGLDYVSLGQSATTLSSGEAQRLKLAAFLSGAVQKPTLFILDEPTTGLHFADIERLKSCFDSLLQAGHSLIVVEHNPQLIRAADYLIDLGPGAADRGGEVVAYGPPAEVSKVAASRTGLVLAELRSKS